VPLRRVSRLEQIELLLLLGVELIVAGVCHLVCQLRQIPEVIFGDELLLRELFEQEHRLLALGLETDSDGLEAVEFAVVGHEGKQAHVTQDSGLFFAEPLRMRGLPLQHVLQVQHLALLVDAQLGGRPELLDGSC